jgi:hypothetical protein
MSFESKRRYDREKYSRHLVVVEGTTLLLFYSQQSRGNDSSEEMKGSSSDRKRIKSTQRQGVEYMTGRDSPVWGLQA